MVIKQIEQFSDIILRSRLESQSWNSFNPFPIANRVSAGVPTPPDSGKTPQLKTSKLAQNCGKIEVLHLQLLTESAGVMKSKLFPQCKQRIHPVLLPDDTELRATYKNNMVLWQRLATCRRG